MKKSYFWLAGLLSFGMLLAGCEEKPTTDDSGDDATVDSGLSGEMDEISSTKAKSRLSDIGVEFLGAINANTHENLVEVMDYVEEEYGYYDIDEDYLLKLEELYSVSGGNDYEAPARKANPVAAVQGLMALSLDAAQNGAQLASRADDIYMLTVEAGLSDLYGGFKPNTRNEYWAYDSSIKDRLEVQFTDDHNQKWVATLKGSKETTRVRLKYEDKYEDISKYTYNSYYYEDEVSVDKWGSHSKVNYTIDVPKEITLSVTCNKEEIVKLVVKSDVALTIDGYENDSYYREYESGYDDNYDYYWTEYQEVEREFNLKVDYTNLSVDAQLNVNGYEESWVVEASKKNIKSTAEVKIDGKSMLKAEAAANGDVEDFIKQMNDANTYTETYAGSNEEYGDWEGNDFEFDPSCLKNFAMKVDMMGKAQIYGKCDDFTKFYEAYYLTEEEWEDKYGKYSESKAWEKYIEAINKTYEITVHYDNTTTVQANIEFEGVEIEVDDYYETYTYYGARPVIVFAADDSRYAFEDYFTEKNFRKVFNAFETLAEEFEDMFGQYFESEEEDYYPGYDEY